MKAVAGLALLLVNVRLSRSCYGEGEILFCLNIPSAFRPGYSSLVMILKDVGEINSTVFRSDDLASVTRLRIEAAGVTGIAEGAFGSFQNLTHLSLNQNLLTEMNPNWFGRPGILSELSLTENQVEVLNEFMFNGLSNLTRLNLNKNGIRTIDPDSFSSQTVLAELDLSENRLTRVSPQVFRSLRSTRIRLDGNPWDCSCGAEDFVDFLKDLQSRFLLDRQMEVTCESPPSLRDRPVWNVSVCETSPPPRPPSAPQTVQPKPTDLLTVVPASTDTSVVTAAPARPTSETKTSVQPKPTDILTTVTTPALKIETSVTSPPSVTEISLHPKPSYLPTYTISTRTGMTETCVTSRPSSDTNILCTLVVVIVVLSLLLFVACFLTVLHRRKRHSKTVMPGCPKENESKEENSRSSRAQSPGGSEKRENNHWDSEMEWTSAFTGVRAKSANAIFFTSPFCATVRDQLTLQTETEARSKDTENQAEGKQKLASGNEADGGFETEILTNPTDVNAQQVAHGINLDKETHCVSVNADAVPYLSIGTNQNISDDLNKESTDSPSQRSQTGKVMGRISTWPPTAVQWQARCKMMEEKEKEEGSDVFSVWLPKLPDEVKKALNKVEHEDHIEKDPLKMNVALMKLGLSQSSKPTDETPSFSLAYAYADRKQEEQLKKEVMIQDPDTVRQIDSDTRNLNQEELGQTQDLKPAEKNSNKSSSQTEERHESKGAVTNRRRPENRSTGSKAPSGGASPDDETLLSGNEYAFMDLLHEVVQNNGRWTRERWRQIHANKQRR